MAWTDERLDDLSNRLEVGFDRLHHDLRDVRTEVGALRTEIWRVGGAIIVCLLGAIVALSLGS
jgi:hypothetical protein